MVGCVPRQGKGARASGLKIRSTVPARLGNEPFPLSQALTATSRIRRQRILFLEKRSLTR
jgi:hypothetical protein